VFTANNTITAPKIDGLKIRSREKRGMGSNPIIGTSKNAFLLGEIVRICDLFDCEWSRTETQQKTVYSSSIGQVNTCNPGFRYRGFRQAGQIENSSG
jgi:hypothetical protein